MSTTREMRSRILRLAIAVPILISAPIWSLTEAYTSDSRQRQLSADRRNSLSTTARVEIDLFSGRPNPSFELDQEAAHELLGLLSNLKQGDVKFVPRDGLGFRGFTVSVDGQPKLYISGPVVSTGSDEFVDGSR